MQRRNYFVRRFGKRYFVSEQTCEIRLKTVEIKQNFLYLSWNQSTALMIS